MRRPLLWLILPLLAACGGEDSGGSSGTPPTATPSPAPAPAPAPAPTPSPTPTPTPTPIPPVSGDFAARAAALYDEAPDLAACRAGRLKSEVTARVLDTLNEVRRLHRLPTVGYSTADDTTVQAAALVLSANEALTHEPPTTFRCFTTAALNGTRSSNLYGGLGSGLGFLSDEGMIVGWLTDVDNAIANNIGHRRWLLDPFLGNIAYGRVAVTGSPSGRVDSSALKVIGTTGATIPAGGLPAFVAYPYEDYPARFFDTRALLSFGVIASATNRSANGAVNLSGATIAVRQRGGEALTVSNISADNIGYGLPNSVQFNVAGLRAETTYDVTIGNVVVNGTPTTYTYYFRITP